MASSLLSLAQANADVTAAAEQGSGGAGALLGCLLIFGVLCAICGALNKKDVFDVSGTIRQR